MKMFKNSNFKTAFLAAAVLSAALTAVGFILNIYSGVVCAVLSAVLLTIFYLYVKHVNKKTASLSDKIDHILHNPAQINIGDDREGELSILESEISKMTLRLKEQNEMLKKDKEFLKDAIENIFHQLRTPLTSMELTVSMLRSGEISDEKRRELTGNLKTQTEKITYLTETLLKMSKIDSNTAYFKSEKINVKELIETAADELGILIDVKNITAEIKAEKVYFTGDRMWTAQALENIIKNSTEHTGENGRITISASENPIYTEIVISDDGDSIDETEIPRIFDRFYSGKGSGYGIGLALSQMIIKQQNGTVEVRNNIDKGVSFIIKFYKTETV